MMQTTALWYAVYTKPKWEKKVAGLLHKRGITAYCPLNKVVKQWHDRKKTIEEPLFTSYVFVQVTTIEQLEVRKADGVFNFVHWLGKPAVIRAEEIATIKEFLSQHKNVQVEKTNVKSDDCVQIKKGVLMNREGKVLEVLNKRIKVELPSLGYNMVAHVEIENVAIITKPSHFKRKQMSVI